MDVTFQKPKKKKEKKNRHIGRGGSGVGCIFLYASHAPIHMDVSTSSDLYMAYYVFKGALNVFLIRW